MANGRYRDMEEGTEDKYVTGEIWEDPASGSPFKVGSYTRIGASSYRRTIGHNTPDFHKKKRRGDLLPFTSFKQWETEGKCTTSYWTSYPNGAKRYSVGDFILGPADGWNFYEEEAAEQLEGQDGRYFLQAAAAAIYSSGWDALTFAAEFHKTLDMFRGFVRRLINLAKSGQLHKLWLEGRYGWRTLYYDMKDIEEAIVEFDTKRTRYSEHVGSTTVSSDQHLYTSSGGSGTVHYSRDTDWKIGVRGSIVADIQPSIGRFNPVLTGWELITLSFVIDWVINIGQWLAALSFMVFSTNSTGAIGFNVTGTRTVRVLTAHTNPGYDGIWNITSNFEGSLTVRTPASIPLSPFPQLRLNTFKILDLVALLINYLPCSIMKPKQRLKCGKSKGRI